MKSKAILVFGLAAFRLAAADAGTPDFFENKIRPVRYQLLRLPRLQNEIAYRRARADTKTGMARGGNSGAIIVAGKREASMILKALRYNDLPKMPPSGKLPDAVIKDFEQWIAAGAPNPRVEAPGAVPTAGGPRVIDFAAGLKWWAFSRFVNARASRERQCLGRTKIDSFILANLEKHALKPSPEADPRTLVTRLYIDLLGYKPTYDEIQAYVNDTSKDRYERLVEHLLASPHYGERWARYWLDVARYGEDGLAGAQYMYAWRYRDWVVDAFNQDVPYNKFLKLQLAADQMPNTPRADLAALGYLALGPVEHKELKLSKDVIEGLWLDEWDERLDAVSRGMMGLTVACARCHDHKFDPIRTKTTTRWRVFSPPPRRRPPAHSRRSQP